MTINRSNDRRWAHVVRHGQKIENVSRLPASRANVGNHLDMISSFRVSSKQLASWA
jgi:hypothetical protein